MNIMIIGNGFDKQHGIDIDFKDFVRSEIFRSKIGKQYASFFKNDKPLWSDFEGHLLDVCQKNKIKQKFFVKKVTKIFQDWIEEIKRKIKYKKDSFVEQIINEHRIESIISLNYTDTASQYGFKMKKFEYDSIRPEWNDLAKMKHRCIDIHSFLPNQKDIYSIIGNDQNQKISKDIFIKEWYEKTSYNPKQSLLKSILKNKKVKKIVIYGYSFGNSDQTLNQFLINFLNDKDNKRTIKAYYKGKINRIDDRILYSQVKN